VPADEGGGLMRPRTRTRTTTAAQPPTTTTTTTMTTAMTTRTPPRATGGRAEGAAPATPPARAGGGRGRGGARAVGAPPPGVAPGAQAGDAADLRSRGWESGQAAIREPRPPPVSSSAVLKTLTPERGSRRPGENPLPDSVVAAASKEGSDAPTVTEGPYGLDNMSDGMKDGESPQSKPSSIEPGHHDMVLSLFDHKYKVSDSVTVAGERALMFLLS
jgi:hypothetical protein